jgi:hypothetical protein
MSHRTQASSPTQSPIERIFEEVMHRNMTSQEKIYFHLKPKFKPLPTIRTKRRARAA